MDPNLWDGSMHSISIFELNKLLNTNAHNITISFQKKALYIRERLFKDKKEKYIPLIAGIGYAT